MYCAFVMNFAGGGGGAAFAAIWATSRTSACFGATGAMCWIALELLLIAKRCARETVVFRFAIAGLLARRVEDVVKENMIRVCAVEQKRLTACVSGSFVCMLNTVSEYNCVAFNSKGILAFFPRLFLKNIFGHCTRVILFSNSNSFKPTLCDTYYVSRTQCCAS